MSRKSRRRRWAVKQLAARVTLLGLTGKPAHPVELIENALWELCAKVRWDDGPSLVVPLPHGQSLLLGATLEASWKRVASPQAVWEVALDIVWHYPSAHSQWQCLQAIEKVTAWAVSHPESFRPPWSQQA